MLKRILSLIPLVCIFLYFVFVEPSHIRFQEQYQMFLFTSDYLREVFTFPGSTAVYLGRFLTQFFISPPAGAMVIAFLFWLVQMLTYRTIGRKNGYAYTLSFIPSILLALYHCDENAFLSADIAFALGLAMALPLQTICEKWKQTAAAIILAAAAYFLGGNISALVFAAAAFMTCRDIKIGIGCVIISFLCTYASKYILDYPFVRLLTGPHYHRYHDTIPVLPWAAAFSIWIISLLRLFTVKNISGKWPRLIYGLAICGLVSGLFIRKDEQKEEMMTYSYLTQCEDWDGIMKFAARKEPVDPISLSCVNLALARTGYLGEWMFRFRQDGRDCLFYPYRREHISPIPASVVYWNLGFINTSLRFTFAAQEVIPDYQKSSWCHKRLAETYLVLGQYDLARKYLEPLKYTLFQRRWAKSTEKLLDHPELIETDKTYGPVRARMLKDHHCTYVVSGLQEPLYYLCLEDRSNTLAYQYMLALDLLDKNLDHFAEIFSASGYKTVPTAYQEAYILYWSQDHSGPEGLPSFISQSTIDRFMRFSSDFGSGDEEYIWNKYSNTYWFYYFFRNHQE